MAKTYIDTIKYMVYANIVVDGIVEKPDVVGAIFGQTEGLLGDELDLRDLQKSGRIGRIEVDLHTSDGRTKGVIKIPSSLDMVETSIIAAALESVDRVGPCEAKVKVEKIEDTRNQKRKMVIERAKELLKSLLTSEIPESKEISEMVREEVKTAEIIHYGEEKLPAGPNVDKMDEVIIVEGRADVLNLLRNNITNVIALGGAKVPKTIEKISKEKEITVFLDGDRGGDIILNELIHAGVEIDFVARAPVGREVEELTRKEIIKALRNKVPFEQISNGKKRQVKQEIKITRSEAKSEKTVEEESKESKVKKTTRNKVDLMEELEGLHNTLKAKLYNENLEVMKEVPVREITKAINETEGIYAIVFDGIITQRLVDIASSKGINTIVGMKIGHVVKRPAGIKIITKGKI